ncbi:MAG TPA: flagellar biosynthetic protein FliR [Rugosimonospora sp.]|nr:flagellar biosynthetic protein FliR [Rugosimonospora sp.]
MLAQVPLDGLIALLLASIRAGAWLIVAPPFDSRLLPTPVKALLSVAISLPVVPSIAAHVPATTVPALLASAVEQMVVGAALGFIAALIFSAVQAAGDLIDLFGGINLSFAFDPFSMSQSSIFGRLYHLLAITLLFASDGYQMVLHGFLLSYRTLPLDGTLPVSTVDRILTYELPAMFVAALQIAGPLIAVLFCADVALGLLNRVAPALNAFALGFPAKILLTLVLAGSAIMVLPESVRSLVTELVRAILGAAGG